MDKLIQSSHFNIKNYLKDISNYIFKLLDPEEELSLYLHSEESQFVRFTNSKVRQNTSVYQHELTLQYQSDQKILSTTILLTLELRSDQTQLKNELNVFREIIPYLDQHPQYVPFVNNGTSESIKKINRPSDIEFIDIITKCFKGSDMAGLFCSGPVRKASVNSKGQFHYFENDFFFLDYSIYNGSKAAKGFFSISEWDQVELEKNIFQTIEKLNQLNKPVQTIRPGQYRTYLEPMAMQEILMTLGWGSFSMSAAKQGRTPLRKFIDKEVSLSPLLNLSENLGLGYLPLFNSLGEIGPQNLELIKNGEFANLLISTATAKEFSLTSNQAQPEETYKSPEVKAGTLKQEDILNKIGTGLYLSNLHYINWSDQQSARLTGMTRYACFWVENGKIIGPIQDLRFDDSIYNLLGTHLLELSLQQELFVESSTYLKRGLGAFKTPGALIDKINFTL